jgi:hypothetical protein|tara:strand:+ start:538 stop:834 length:297 start_codon:yes stop_codon:yes gene_type:complete
MAKITDPSMEPYFIGKDTHCYTVYEVVTPQEKYLEKGSEGKDYEKPLGHFSTFGGALQKIAKQKLHNEKDHYHSIQEYVERWDELIIELKKLQNYREL